LKVVWTSQLRKDYKRAGKRGCPLDELKRTAKELADGKTLDPKHKDYYLKGFGKKPYRECHVKLDWLLIYRIKEDAVVFIRDGDTFGFVQVVLTPAPSGP
jgi:mRNA interferase YafQ